MAIRHFTARHYQLLPLEYITYDKCSTSTRASSPLPPRDDCYCNLFVFTLAKAVTKLLYSGFFASSSSSTAALATRPTIAALKPLLPPTRKLRVPSLKLCLINLATKLSPKPSGGPTAAVVATRKVFHFKQYAMPLKHQAKPPAIECRMRPGLTSNHLFTVTTVVIDCFRGRRRLVASLQSLIGGDHFFGVLENRITITKEPFSVEKRGHSGSIICEHLAEAIPPPIIILTMAMQRDRECCVAKKNPESGPTHIATRD